MRILTHPQHCSAAPYFSLGPPTFTLAPGLGLGHIEQQPLHLGFHHCTYLPCWRSLESQLLLSPPSQGWCLSGCSWLPG